MMFEACERETIISTNDEDKKWEVYTRQKKMITLFKNKGYEPVRIEMEGDSIVAAYFEIDLSKISVRKANTKVREYTDEERKEMAERMRAIRNKS